MPIEMYTTNEDLSPGDLVTFTPGGVRRVRPGETRLGVAVKAEGNDVAVYMTEFSVATLTINSRKHSMVQKQLDRLAKGIRLMELCLNNPYAIEIEEARPFRPAPTDLEIG